MASFPPKNVNPGEGEPVAGELPGDNLFVSRAPLVTVVIPCYNHGKFIKESIDSVLAQTYADFEIVVVNDGSTDPLTTTLLGDFQREKTTVVHTANQGLAEARNTGIRRARGRYILPLDADDRIAPAYLEQAVAILEADPEVGIVYCRAQLFGAADCEWQLPEYSLEAMLFDNIIFCSALFRREDWQLSGGYDPGMIYGWEDYEFWLGLLERGRRVVKIPEILFYYRVASDSMVRSRERWQKVAMFERAYQRHQALFSRHIGVWITEILGSRENYRTSRLYADCGQGVSDAGSVCRNVDRNTRQLAFSLAGFSGIAALRFDPVDCPAVLAIDQAVLVDDAGATRPVGRIKSNALYHEQGLLFFSSPDPQCFFPDLTAATLDGAQSLVIDLRIEALGAEALAAIVNLQIRKIAAGAGGKGTEKLPPLRKIFSGLLARPRKDRRES